MPKSSINENEASAVDLRVYKELEALGWTLHDTMLYQPSYALNSEQQKEFPGRKSIKPEFVLQDFDQTVLAVIEDKLDDPNKALPKLRLLYSQVLKPRFLYACSKERNLFYDMAWKGIDAGEFRPVSGFLSLEDMRLKITQERQKAQGRAIIIDKTIAGGFDPAAGKERYFQTECIEVLLRGYRDGKGKMLVHMATGLGKTRMAVGLVKALLEYGLAKRVLFVADRRLLAEQAKDDGFALISPTYNTAWITTGNFKTHRNKDVHVVVIDTLEAIFDRMPSNFYDPLVVDECHRSINISRKVIFDHFLCPRIGLTATPRIAVPKLGAQVPDEDLAIMDTYRLFGCETGKPDYEFDIDRGIREGFLAPYKVKEIKTELTRLAEEKGVEFDYVLDPDERKKIELDQTKKLTLEQLNQKYLTENQAKRIAEEIRANTEYGEKMILFGVSQVHCLMLAKALNEVFNDDGSESPRYAEAVISENQDLNKALKGWFKKPYQNPRIVVSVDIMSTGVDIPCVRYIGFAALTKSVGKYIQMLGRGTRLDPKTGKFSFQVLDFVGLCKRMLDNGKGSPKPNTTTVGPGGTGGGGGQTSPPGPWYIVDNPDPAHLIQRVMVHEGAVKVIDNIPMEEARRIFEEQVKRAADPAIAALKQKAQENRDYEPTEDELAKMSDWVRKPDIYMDEGQLQKIFDYPAGSVWDFFLNVLGVKRIPTSAERIERGFETYLSTYSFNDQQVGVLRKIKDVFVSNITSHGKVDLDSIFANPIYERLIGRFEEVDRLFDGKLKAVIHDMQECFRTAA